MAENRFNIEPLIRSANRGTLLDYAQLPDVQPGPSTGAQIADSLFQFLEGGADRVLKSKELDLQAQMNAAQIDTTRQNLILNQNKQEFEETKYLIGEAEENLGEVSYEDAINYLNPENQDDSMFPDNEAGRKAQKFWNERFASVKPQFDYVKKVNELTDGMDIIDILNIDHKVKGPDGKDISISGEQMIDRYGRLMSGDSKINLAKKSALINEYEKYNQNRGYFQLVSNI